MKREYFGMLYIIVFVACIFGAEYFFGEDVVMDKLSTFIVVWIVLSYFVGQYSTRFPKTF